MMTTMTTMTMACLGESMKIRLAMKFGPMQRVLTPGAGGVESGCHQGLLLLLLLFVIQLLQLLLPLLLILLQRRLLGQL